MLSVLVCDSIQSLVLPGAIRDMILGEREADAEKPVQAERRKNECIRAKQDQAHAERERIAEIVRDVMAAELPDALEVLGAL